MRISPLTFGVMSSLLVASACSHPQTGGGSAHHAAVPIDTMPLLAPDGSAPPSGDLGRSILRGHAILADTWDSLPTHVGNGLRCTSCHLDDGRRPTAIPLTGVYARYPQYRSRNASIQSIEDRVNDCFQRSLNGTALAMDDPALRDIVAYLAWISRGVPVTIGDPPAGPGFPLGTARTGDTAAGGRVFLRECSPCHGGSGEGTLQAPPLWGDRSFNIGAGMARVRTFAAFIRANMPFDKPGSLTDQQAFDLAAFVTSRPRPDLAGKERDWPNGDPPPDVAYPTAAGRHPAAAARTTPTGAH